MQTKTAQDTKVMDGKESDYSSLKESKRFVECTSLRGVPRIVKSDLVCLKVSWFFVCGIGFGITGFHSFTLINAYFQYPVSTVVEESLVQLVSAAEKRLLPELTFCNLNPINNLNQTVYQELNIKSYEEYLKEVKNITTSLSSSSQYRQKLLKYKPTLSSTVGYYQYLGVESSLEVGHTMSQFILSCKVILTQSAASVRESCDGLVNITQVSHSKYFNCFSFRPFTQTRQKQIIGFDIVFNLGLNVSSLATGVSHKERHGVIVGIHQPDAHVYFERDGYELAAGTFSTIRIRPQMRVRKSQPYGSCVTRYDSPTYTRHDGTPYLYTALACWSACVEAYVVQACHCNDAALLGIMLPYYSNISFCGNISVGAETVISRVSCAEDTRIQTYSECYYSCQLACEETVYFHTTSSIVWPNLNDMQSLYDMYFANTESDRYFSEIISNISMSADFYHTIQNNVLGVALQLSDYKYLKITDSEKISMSGLISQLGGALNLWSGISIMVIVEIGELFFRIIWGYVNRNQVQHISYK